MSNIPWSISEDSYDINFSIPQTMRLRFTKDCFGQDWEQLTPLFKCDNGKARLQVWIDAAVASNNPNLLTKIASSLDDSREALELASAIQVIEGGEQAKNDESTVDQIFRQIDQDGLDRRSYVVVVGGGALLDAVGYAAAIAHRGIRLVRFPTTTLAQGDSGIGVKNAINAYGKKNWKGTFSVPWAVINDQSLLSYLPDRDFRSGFSEAVKVALLKSPSAFHYLCRHATDIAGRDWSSVMPALRSSVLMHMHHITHGGDPFEMQEARPLDFGHWSAHRLEHLTNYSLRHGEAVAIGVALDTVYSHLVHGLDRADMMSTLQFFQDLQLPIFDPVLETDAIFRGLEEFRQHLGGRLTLTMLKGVGHSISAHTVNESAMREAIAILKNRTTIQPSQPAYELREGHG